MPSLMRDKTSLAIYPDTKEIPPSSSFFLQERCLDTKKILVPEAQDLFSAAPPPLLPPLLPPLHLIHPTPPPQPLHSLKMTVCPAATFFFHSSTSAWYIATKGGAREMGMHNSHSIRTCTTKCYHISAISYRTKKCQKIFLLQDVLLSVTPNYELNYLCGVFFGTVANRIWTELEKKVCVLKACAYWIQPSTRHAVLRCFFSLQNLSTLLKSVTDAC